MNRDKYFSKLLETLYTEEASLIIPGAKFKKGEWIKTTGNSILGKVDNIQLKVYYTTDPEEYKAQGAEWRYTVEDDGYLYLESELLKCTESEIEEHIKWLEQDEADYQEELKSRGK